MLAGLLFGTVLWASGIQTSHNKAIDLEEDRRRELLVEAFRLCPKGPKDITEYWKLRGNSQIKPLGLRAN